MPDAAAIEQQAEIATKAMLDLLDQIPDGVDRNGVLYFLCVHLINLLVSDGWTLDQLTRDLQLQAARG